jgi:hypothetical protein
MDEGDTRAQLAGREEKDPPAVEVNSAARSAVAMAHSQIGTRGQIGAGSEIRSRGQIGAGSEIRSRGQIGARRPAAYGTKQRFQQQLVKRPCGNFDPQRHIVAIVDPNPDVLGKYTDLAR